MKGQLGYRTTFSVLAIISCFLGAQAIYAYLNTSIVVEWSTASELNTAGFNLYRGEREDGPFEIANEELIPPSDDPLTGGEYSYVDSNIDPGKVYFYNLEEIEMNGNVNLHGPIEIKASYDGFIEGLLAIVVFIGALVGIKTFAPSQKLSAGDV